MQRSATAVWKGGPLAGEGTVSTQSGVFRNIVYTIGTSAIDFPCTNPIEMLAAAEAACVSLMVAKELSHTGITADRITTTADLTVAGDDEGWYVPRIHLRVSASANCAPEKLKEAIAQARADCPITRSLKSEVTLETVLEQKDVAVTG